MPLSTKLYSTDDHKKVINGKDMSSTYTGFETGHIKPQLWTLDASDASAQPAYCEAKIEEIYQPELSPRLFSAIHLIDNAVKRIDDALSAFLSDDVVAADDETNHLHMLLNELFCCRDLGDGLGAIVNAMAIALESQAGVPLDEIRIRAFRLALGRLRAEPYLDFDSALAVIDRLEAAGLRVEPASLDKVADEP